MHSKHHINARLGDPTAAAATITHRNRRFKNEISDSGILCELGDDVKCTIRVGDASRVKNVRRTHSKGNSRVFTSVLKSHLPKNDGGEEYVRIPWDTGVFSAPHLTTIQAEVCRIHFAARIAAPMHCTIAAAEWIACLQKPNLKHQITNKTTTPIIYNIPKDSQEQLKDALNYNPLCMYIASFHYSKVPMIRDPLRQNNQLPLIRESPTPLTIASETAIIYHRNFAVYMCRCRTSRTERASLDIPEHTTT